MWLINRFFLLFILLCPLLGYTQAWQIKLLDRMLLAQGTSNVRLANNNQEKRQQQEIKKLLILAKKQLNRMQLTLPIGNNAYETYQRVLKIDPNNDEAKQGVVKICDRYQKLAEQYAKRGLLKKSLRIIKRGLRIVPDHSGLLAQQAVVEKTLLEVQREAEAMTSKAEIEAEIRRTSVGTATKGAWKVWRNIKREAEREVAAVAVSKDLSVVRPTPPSVDNPLERVRSASHASHIVVRIFYATDRNRTSEAKPAEMFGNDRGTLSFGYSFSISIQTCDQVPPSTHPKYSGRTHHKGEAISATTSRPTAEWVTVRWPKRRSSGTDSQKNSRPIFEVGKSASGSSEAAAASSQPIQSGL